MGFNLPVSFKEFLKEPVKAILYLCIIAISYLYIDGKKTAHDQQKAANEAVTKCETKNYLQDVKIDYLTQRMMRSDSLANRVQSKLETLKELGKIQ